MRKLGSKNCDEGALISASRVEEEPALERTEPDVPAKSLPWEIEQHTWPFIRQLADSAIRRMPPRQDNLTPSIDFTDFESMLCSSELTSIDSRTEFLFLRFDLPQQTPQVGFDALSMALAFKEALVCVGASSKDAGYVWAAVRMGNYRKVTIQDMTINGVVPEVRRVDTSHVQIPQRPAVILEVLKKFSKSMDSVYGDFAVVEPESEWTSDMILSLTDNLTDTLLLKIKADAQLAGEKTSFQEQFLKVFSTITQLRQSKRNCVDKSSTIRLHGPQDPGLQFRELINLEQTCVRLDEVSGEYVSVTLREFVKSPSFFLSYGLIILGSNETTGFGKSLAGLVICLHWVANFLRAGLLTSERAYVLYQNTIDSMRDSQDMQAPYVPILLDEFKPSCQEQNQYCSAETIKALAAVSKPRDLRARQSQVRLYANQPVVITADADSVEDWCSPRFLFTAPCARKCFVMQMESPLIPDHVRSAGPAQSTTGHSLLSDLLADD